VRQGSRDGISIAGITDGTSNTFMVVEAGKAVPWTKPEDVPFDPAQPLPPLGGRFTRIINVLFAEGSVRAIQSDNPEAALKLYIQKDDNNIVPELK